MRNGPAQSEAGCCDTMQVLGRQHAGLECLGRRWVLASTGRTQEGGPAPCGQAQPFQLGNVLSLWSDQGPPPGSTAGPAPLLLLGLPSPILTFSPGS